LWVDNIGMGKHIIISKGTELLRIPAERLMFVTSDGNYSNITTEDGRTRLVTLQLGQIEDILQDQLTDAESNFLRLGRSLIINTNYIHFIDISKQQLILSNCKNSYHQLTASREVLIKLKAYIEATITK
jgi:DNA-binding LytR/AlgR family response regulator